MMVIILLGDCLETKANVFYSFTSTKLFLSQQNVRGSPPYYQRTFYEFLAMIRQLGTPTWLFTLSAGDMKWPDMMARYDSKAADEQVQAFKLCHLMKRVDAIL